MLPLRCSRPSISVSKSSSFCRRRSPGAVLPACVALISMRFMGHPVPMRRRPAGDPGGPVRSMHEKTRRPFGANALDCGRPGPRPWSAAALARAHGGSKGGGRTRFPPPGRRKRATDAGRPAAPGGPGQTVGGGHGGRWAFGVAGHQAGQTRRLPHRNFGAAPPDSGRRRSGYSSPFLPPAAGRRTTLGTRPASAAGVASTSNMAIACAVPTTVVRRARLNSENQTTNAQTWSDGL